MKKLLLAVVVIAMPARAQLGNTVMRQFAGAPSGSCSFIQLANDTTNGNFYFCKGGVWQQLGAFGGGIAVGDPVTGGTTGSILFVGAGPVLAQNNPNFFWDNTNLRLGVGTGGPTRGLHIVKSGAGFEPQLAACHAAGECLEVLLTAAATVLQTAGASTRNIGLGAGTATEMIVAPKNIYLSRTSFVDPVAKLFIDSTDTTRVDLIIRQVASQTSDMIQLQDSAGAVITKISAGGKITTYNNVAADASHSGVPFTTQSATATAQAANIVATNLIASATAGRYRLSCYIAVTQQATTSSTVPNCNLICTDPTDSVAKTIQVTPAIQGVAANPATSVGVSGAGICDAKTLTAVQYSTSGYASAGATPMQYKIYVTLETM